MLEEKNEREFYEARNDENHRAKNCRCNNNNHCECYDAEPYSKECTRRNGKSRRDKKMNSRMMKTKGNAMKTWFCENSEIGPFLNIRGKMGYFKLPSSKVPAEYKTPEHMNAKTELSASCKRGEVGRHGCVRSAFKLDFWNEVAYEEIARMVYNGAFPGAELIIYLELAVNACSAYQHDHPLVWCTYMDSAFLLAQIYSRFCFSSGLSLNKLDAILNCRHFGMTLHNAFAYCKTKGPWFDTTILERLKYVDIFHTIPLIAKGSLADVAKYMNDCKNNVDPRERKHAYDFSFIGVKTGANRTKMLGVRETNHIFASTLSAFDAKSVYNTGVLHAERIFGNGYDCRIQFASRESLGMTLHNIVKRHLESERSIIKYGRKSYSSFVNSDVEGVSGNVPYHVFDDENWFYLVNKIGYERLCDLVPDCGDSKEEAESRFEAIIYDMSWVALTLAGS
jgi:hypothetical protein